MRTPARALLLLLAPAVVLVVAGVVLFSAGSASYSFGWFAYAPMVPGVRGPWLVLWSPRQALGAALVVLGLLAAAAAGGYSVGRRR